jgi:hypothetical protein
MIQLVGPGGAGKSTMGALLAERLDVAVLDLDRHFNGRAGDISEYLGRHGYDAYARENVETCCSLFPGGIRPEVLALSSGFMTYARDIHPQYVSVCHEIGEALPRSCSYHLWIASSVWPRPFAGKSRVHLVGRQRWKKP